MFSSQKKEILVLNLFKDRLSMNKTAIIDDYLSEKVEQIKKELNIFSDYVPDNKDSFIVTLKALEGDCS